MIYIISGIFILILVSLVLYIKGLLKTIHYILDDVDYVKSLFKDFTIHLERIYSMEMFYGDAVVQDLLTHSKELNKQLKDFDQYYEEFGTMEIREEEKGMINNEQE